MIAIRWNYWYYSADNLHREGNWHYHSQTRNDISVILMYKNLYFSFDGEIYVQIDSVKMGFPLEALANFFMVELDNTIIPHLEHKIKTWKRHVNDTICFAKVDSMNLVSTVLNSLHNNIKFTLETEND